MADIFADQITDGPEGLPTLDAPVVSEDTQKQNMMNFDLPIPGQSLTAEQGAAAYERPPEFNDSEDAMDFLFERMTQPKTQKNLLRMMDAGVPVTLLAEPILLHGVQEGKWNMDLALLLMEPMAVVMYGLGERAGISVVLTPPEKEDPGVNMQNFKKIFKNKVSDRKQALLDELDAPKPTTEGLVSRRTK
jgi:hypothetical protein